MKIAARFVYILSVLSIAVLGCSCAQEVSFAEVMQLPENAKVYTAYNLRYQKNNEVSCINFQRGKLLPFGTEVEVLHASNKLIKFVDTGTAMEYTIIVDEDLLMMPVEEYLRRVFTLKNAKELSKGIKKKYLRNIKAGVVIRGMNRREVLLCCGYPAAFRTPSLDNATWIYYLDKYNSFRAVFRGGRVRAIIDISKI